MLVRLLLVFVCYYSAAAATEIYTYLHTLSLHDALPIFDEHGAGQGAGKRHPGEVSRNCAKCEGLQRGGDHQRDHTQEDDQEPERQSAQKDRKSTRLNSSH